MKTVVPILLALMVSAHCALALTIYVDAANSSGIEDGTDEHPFDTIREGLFRDSCGSPRGELGCESPDGLGASSDAVRSSLSRCHAPWRDAIPRVHG